MFRKIFEFFHNTKPDEKNYFERPPEFPLRLIRESSPSIDLHIIKPTRTTGSSQETLITPKESEVNIEHFNNVEIFSPTKSH